MPTKRLSKQQRRTQLLEVAREIIRLEGTDALTLSYLAEHAGVTKPVAYNHFGDREGLLIALYRDFDDHWIAVLRREFDTNATSLVSTVRIFSAAYVDCTVAAGPEIGPIVAALSGSETLRAVLDECRGRYASVFRSALAPFVELSGVHGEAVTIAMIGATEYLADAAGTGKIGREVAKDVLALTLTAVLTDHLATRANPPTP